MNVPEQFLMQLAGLTGFNLFGDPRSRKKWPYDGQNLQERVHAEDLGKLRAELQRSLVEPGAKILKHGSKQVSFSTSSNSHNKKDYNINYKQKS